MAIIYDAILGKLRSDAGGGGTGSLTLLSSVVSNGTDVALVLTGVSATYMRYVLRWERLGQVVATSASILADLTVGGVPIVSTAYRGSSALMRYTDTAWLVQNIGNNSFALGSYAWADSVRSGCVGEATVRIDVGSTEHPSLYAHSTLSGAASTEAGYFVYGGTYFGSPTGIDGLSVRMTSASAITAGGKVELFGMSA